jgi:hypothetical protein
MEFTMYERTKEQNEELGIDYLMEDERLEMERLEALKKVD